MEKDMIHRFLVVFEKTDNNYSAYSPDLPGCVATGKTREDAETAMFEAIQLHIAGLEEDGLAVPNGESFAEHMAIPCTAHG
jgi:predicted RNase H-like HicB family nuclease